MSGNAIVFTIVTSTNVYPYDRQRILTDDDMNNAYTPYINFLNSLPGFQSNEISYTDADNGDVIVTRRIQFDTAENANAAFPQLYGPTQNIAVVNRNKMLTEKLNEYNASVADADKVVLKISVSIQ